MNRLSSNAYATGYHAQATEVSYVAITSPPSETVALFTHDLRFKEDRVANLVHLIRLSPVLVWMGGQLRSPDLPQYVDVLRYVASPLFVC